MRGLGPARLTWGTQGSDSHPPLLLALQQLAVGIDLHVQSQLDVQQLLVLVQLLLHACPHLGHLPVLVGEQAPVGLALPGQGVLQIVQLCLLGSQLSRERRSGRPPRLGWSTRGHQPGVGDKLGSPSVPTHLLLQVADFGGEAVDADADLLQLFVGSARDVAVPLGRLLGVLQLDGGTGRLEPPVPSIHQCPGRWRKSHGAKP